MNLKAIKVRLARDADRESIDGWLASTEERLAHGRLPDDRLAELLHSVEWRCWSSCRGVPSPGMGLTSGQLAHARALAAAEVRARGGRCRLGPVEWVSDDGRGLRVELPA